MVKTQITKKAILNGFPKVIAIGYCGAQFLLTYKNAQYYTYSNMYGWRADVYIISDDIAIVTGYAPFGNIRPNYDLVNEFENKARLAFDNIRHYEDRRDVVNSYLNEFIKKALED